MPPSRYLWETFQCNAAEAVARIWREGGRTRLVGLRPKLLKQRVHNNLWRWRRRSGASIISSKRPGCESPMRERHSTMSKAQNAYNIADNHARTVQVCI